MTGRSRKDLFIVCILILATVNAAFASRPFVTVKDGRFKIGKKDYYYIGANFWYGAILGSKGQGGNRVRLVRELDLLKGRGVNNLRVLVGADGPERTSKVSPSLQTAPGVYNDSILDGLDFLLSEMRKRDMKAVLYLGNAWEWSGGYSQYLEWSGYGKAPVPAVDGWDTFSKYVAQFVKSDSCKTLFKRHVAYILHSTNRYTRQKYIQDPTIMAWQIANEPRAFSESGKTDFAVWIKHIAAYMKSIDPHHLISTGSEGLSGSEGDLQLYEAVHADPSIDYLTIHIWPNNWGWLNKDDLPGSVNTAILHTQEYLDKHVDFARKIKKPLVIEEFGFPRDRMRFAVGTPTSLRDQYDQYVFEQVLQSAKAGDVLGGCNFWAWGGAGRATPGHVFWQRGDDYLGDPAQEEQGLNTVFDTDTTVKLVQQYQQQLKQVLK